MGRGLVIALLALAATAMGALVRPAPTSASTGREDDMRGQIAQFLNMERANRGLRALRVDATLQSQAQAWSERNRDAGCETSCHSPHDQGEIVAWGTMSARSGKLAVAWMESASHRDIVLYPEATALGVGVACKHGGEVYATVQFTGVSRPVPATDQDPIVGSEEWGSPCEGPEGPVPSTTTTTSTTVARATTTTAAPKARPTPTTAPARPRVTATTAAPAPAALAPVTTTTAAPGTTLPTTTTTTISPRVGLRADGSDITAVPPAGNDEEALLAQSAATPASAEPAWVAIVVVVVLLSGMRIGAQWREVRAARRFEDGEFRPGL